MWIQLRKRILQRVTENKNKLEQVENKDEQAKQKGKELLTKEGFEEHTHRLVTEDARLILFHR